MRAGKTREPPAKLSDVSIEAAVDDMKTSIQSMRENIARTCAVVDAVLAGERP